MRVLFIACLLFASALAQTVCEVSCPLPSFICDQLGFNGKYSGYTRCDEDTKGCFSLDFEGGPLVGGTLKGCPGADCLIYEGMAMSQFGATKATCTNLDPYEDECTAVTDPCECDSLGHCAYCPVCDLCYDNAHDPSDLTDCEDCSSMDRCQVEGMEEAENLVGKEIDVGAQSILKHRNTYIQNGKTLCDGSNKPNCIVGARQTRKEHCLAKVRGDSACTNGYFSASKENADKYLCYCGKGSTVFLRYNRAIDTYKVTGSSSDSSVEYAYGSYFSMTGESWKDNMLLALAFVGLFSIVYNSYQCSKKNQYSDHVEVEI